MFDLEVTYGEIKYEDRFKEKLTNWLGQNPDNLKFANKQVGF
jgi:hypothetical protein